MRQAVGTKSGLVSLKVWNVPPDIGTRSNNIQSGDVALLGDPNVVTKSSANIGLLTAFLNQLSAFMLKYVLSCELYLLLLPRRTICC